MQYDFACIYSNLSKGILNSNFIGDVGNILQQEDRLFSSFFNLLILPGSEVGRY